MFSPSTSLRAACVAVVSVLAAPAVADQGSAYMNGSSVNRLTVLSNGQEYTRLDPPIIGDLILTGRLEFDTDAAGRVKSWKATPVMAPGYGGGAKVPGLEAYKVSKSYGVGSRPTEIKKNLEFFVPYAAIDATATAMCNKKVAALRAQGKSDKQIFGANHDLSFDVSVKASVDSTGAGQGNQLWEASSAFVLPVRCAKWTGAQVPQGGNGDLADAFRVLSATMKLQEETNAGGLCRVKTVTALRANRAGETIKYRFFHSSGKKSAVFEIKTEANKIAVINRNWDVPNGPGAEAGWFWIEGVGTSFKTNKATYGMNCAASAPGGKVLGG